MTTTVKKSYSTRMICRNRISKNIASGLISGPILHPHVSKDLLMMMVDSIKFIERFSRKSRVRRRSISQEGRI
jgi:hypothetical protein